MTSESVTELEGGEEGLSDGGGMAGPKLIWGAGDSSFSVGSIAELVKAKASSEHAKVVSFIFFRYS